jgi:hypothetical protein
MYGRRAMAEAKRRGGEKKHPGMRCISIMAIGHDIFFDPLISIEN